MRKVAVARRPKAGLSVLGVSLLLNSWAMGATVLTVHKSGDDVVLSWTGTGTAYDGARATDAPFANATTQFIGFGGTSHSYLGAVSNSHSLEFFDVTDETESNRGGNWNGGVLAPLPPVINAGDPGTNIGSLYIGSLGIINGSGFSVIPEEIMVCFGGGVCTQTLSATPTSIGFQTPPGAYSGSVTVTVGGQTSAPASATVMLEDPATGWSSIFDFRFSRQNKSYWVRGTANSVTSLFRVFFDGGSQTWFREDRGGPLFSSTGSCSAQTGRTGRIFCSDGGFGMELQTRVVDTQPPSDIASCVTLQPTIPGLFIFPGTAAVDPNPNGLRADVAYFETSEDGGPTRIRKVAADCSAELDDNYGNFATMFGAINNSMVVDPVNGDLYFADDGEITRITTAESVTVVKTGLPTNTRLASLTREGTDDPGTLLLVAGGVVEALALDNLNADPFPVVTIAGSADAGFGAQVSGGPWLDANVNRTVTVYRDGTDLILRDHPLTDVTLRGPFEVRISSPSATEQFPVGQSRMRPSTFGDTSFSHAVAELEYRDGLSRTTCAKVGDPGPGAPQYDPSPAVPSDCNKPRTSASAICDNVDDIVAGGPGSFVDGGGLVSCKVCGGSQDPCSWEFRITNRHAGDNCKVYFAFDQMADHFAATSDLYTAWKHLHIERERMCAVGGLLFQDYGATGDCGGAGQPACCGTGGEPPCNQILLFDTTNVSQGDVVVLFDEDVPFEDVTDTRTISAPPVDNGDGSITITLNNPWPRSVLASNRTLPSGQVPIFTNGHSGGLCVPAAGSVESDTVGLPGAFSDGVISYHVPTYGIDGSGTVPFYSPVDFGTVGSEKCEPHRFSVIWFENYLADITPFACPDGTGYAGAVPNNYVHVIGAKRGASGDLAQSPVEINTGYLYIDDIVDCCNGVACPSPTGGCDADKQDNMNREVVHHELAHQFDVNACVGFPKHDGRDAWCGGMGGTCLNPIHMSQECVMNDGIPGTKGTDLLVDGIDRFCVEDLAQGDPTCVAMPLEGAMRAAEDPE